MSLGVIKTYFKKLRRNLQGRKINDFMFEIKIPISLFYNTEISFNYEKDFSDLGSGQ